MKKTFFVLLLLLSTVMDMTAETITVWEGSSNQDITFFSGSENYNALIGSSQGQANLSAGDKIEIYYTNAGENNKLWLQDINWTTYSSAITGSNIDILTPGDGVFVIDVSQEFVDAIKSTGLRLRRGNNPTYSFTKIDVVKIGGVEQPSSIVVWEGQLAATLRFTPETGSFLDNYNKLVGSAAGQANLSAGDKIKFYYTGAGDRDEVWFQNKEWNNISEIDYNTPTISSGDGSYEFTVNDAAVNAIREKGLMLRRPDNVSYVFTKVEVLKKQEQPPVSITLNSDGYNTYSNVNTVTVTGAVAYTCTVNRETSKIVLTELGTVIPAGQGVLLKGDGSGTVTFVLGGDEPSIGHNDFKASLKKAATPTDKTVYVLKGNKFMKYVGAELVANKAYIELGSTAGAKTLSIDLNGEATDIGNIGTAGTDDNVALYNLGGQRVGNGTKGILIKNGKKFINK